ncbi:hypothetical protein GCM10009836_23980 [Pseudonocardia ailaonensis]|uniref:HD Cas3-type domain-containing protein n=1 Tax=Pseudonocardia ailaonensis TaxID=367279 RepID=A0ABN2MY30_9PSEU
MTVSDPALRAEDFPEFFRAVHGVDPFPWQLDLTGRVLAEGRWPDLVDVPTGLGKTSMIDIAVFVTAATARTAGAERAGRRRIFFVVDRRLVVDEAFEHATRLSELLQEATNGAGAMARVARALRALAPTASGDLLPVTRMRGGTTWAAAWMDRPDRPGIVLGTVDQVGSRFLFRGYGVSDRRKPLDAALVGTDSLIMVDEAHLATALLTTFGAASQRDQLGLPVPDPLTVRLSATAEPTFETYALDVDAHRGTAVAWRRLNAGKGLRLVESTPKGSAKDIAAQAIEAVSALSGGGRAPAVLVVCNTVDRAREVFTKLRAGLPEADCELLIGRSRPIDRPGLQERVLRLLGVRRRATDVPAVLVATQTVEVGVNLDADALITESASWDALVQRLGRLNRLGLFSDRFPGDGHAVATVVHDGTTDGPVYGAARDATWSTLTTLAEGATGDIDVSPLACRAHTASAFADRSYLRATRGVPVLLGPTLDTWVQTAPVPLNDPPVAPFLHGFDSGAPAVQMVWREGLVEDDPFDGDAELPAERLDALLTQWPPRSPEIVEIPFVAARRWIGGQSPEPVSDVDISGEELGRQQPVADPFRVLAQRASRQTGRARTDAPTRWSWIDAEQLRPGDLVVVPTERGGLDEYGWAPADRGLVADVSEAASFAPGRGALPAALRLDAGLAARLGLDRIGTEQVTRLLDLPTGEPVDVGVMQSLADSLPVEGLRRFGWTETTWRELAAWLRTRSPRRVEITDPSDDRWGEPEVWAVLLSGPRGAAAPTEGDDEHAGASSAAPAQVTLEAHHLAVRRRAGDIARALGLSLDLAAVVEDAAGWHDLGKVEDRFQAMLHGGDATAAALAREPLAKSGMDPVNRNAWRDAARRSGLPTGARHEAWSAALVEEHLRHLDDGYHGDVDLLLHLIASHHGYARPLAWLVADNDPRDIGVALGEHKVVVRSDQTVDLQQPARFARLNARYGRWGLALLEAVVRCADTTVSGEGS